MSQRIAQFAFVLSTFITGYNNDDDDIIWRDLVCRNAKQTQPTKKQQQSTSTTDTRRHNIKLTYSLIGLHITIFFACDMCMSLYISLFLSLRIKYLLFFAGVYNQSWILTLC